jgi:hypothetical protein
VVDLLANAAFYFGVVGDLVEDECPIWSRLDFPVAAENFRAGARYGLDATVRWPGSDEAPITELIMDTLLPRAYSGLDRLEVGPAQRDRLLGIVEGRCRTRRNGATWQTEAVRVAQERRGLDRAAAVRDMTQRYLELQRANEPVHTWPVR